ncbi:MAG: DUF4292 domain-containing protein [Bacteroidales bacterium]|nr:DUF4292 domain-containing protein [Bacteroidales bacterium]
MMRGRRTAISKAAVLLLFAFVIVSCGTTRRALRAPIKEEGADFLFNKLKENEIRYNTISTKFSADYYNEKNKVSFSGQIRMKKDSLIWVSLSPTLGIEMIRLLITSDSVKMMNRLEKTYFVSDFSYVASFLNNSVDFNMLQSLLTGNDFSFYENSSWKAHIEDQDYQLTTAKRRKLRKYLKKNDLDIIIPEQDIKLSPESFKIIQMLIKEIEGVHPRKLEVDYSGFETFDTQLFPSQIKAVIEAEKELGLDIKYSKISFDQQLSFPFRVSSKYEKVDPVIIREK